MDPKCITCLEDRDLTLGGGGDAKMETDSSAVATKQGRKAATRRWQSWEQILSSNFQGSKTLSAP